MPGTPSKPHLPYIDCIRGYAILMVITCHFTYLFSELPYSVHRLMVTGWFGVQLFFLASSVTLLMSWHVDLDDRGVPPSVGAFFVRRFFRIAPAYYAAGIFYFVLFPPIHGFDARQMITSMTFINAWHPYWTPTVRGAWSVVPGGWSIGVEFSFYLIFPLFAGWVLTLRRALLVFAATVAVGVAANEMAYAALSGPYQPNEIGNFLFMWFPNQMSVFALGGVLFFVVRRLRSPQNRYYELLHKHSDLFAFASIAVFGALAYVPLGHYLGSTPWVPASLAVSIPLMGLVIALATGHSVLVNRFAAAMGRVSFSAYLVHWAVLSIFRQFPATFHINATGYHAIFVFIVDWPLIVLMTYAAAWVSYRVIERPMVNVGKLFIVEWPVKSTLRSS